jgi:hypothetical protein
MILKPPLKHVWPLTTHHEFFSRENLKSLEKFKTPKKVGKI